MFPVLFASVLQLVTKSAVSGRALFLAAVRWRTRCLLTLGQAACRRCVRIKLHGRCGVVVWPIAYSNVKCVVHSRCHRSCRRGVEAGTTVTRFPCLLVGESNGVRVDDPQFEDQQLGCGRHRRQFVCVVMVPLRMVCAYAIIRRCCRRRRRCCNPFAPTQPSRPVQPLAWCCPRPRRLCPRRSPHRNPVRPRNR